MVREIAGFRFQVSGFWGVPAEFNFAFVDLR
jgi:hypothetical protein